MTANTKTLIRLCLLTVTAAAATPARAQFTTNQSGPIRPGLAHTEQGNATPATTAMSGVPALTPLLDPVTAHRPAANVLSFPPAKVELPLAVYDLRVAGTSRVTFTSTVSQTPSAVPAPGPVALLGLAAFGAVRRRKR